MAQNPRILAKKENTGSHTWLDHWIRPGRYDTCQAIQTLDDKHQNACVAWCDLCHTFGCWIAGTRRGPNNAGSVLAGLLLLSPTPYDPWSAAHILLLRVCEQCFHVCRPPQSPPRQQFLLKETMVADLHTSHLCLDKKNILTWGGAGKGEQARGRNQPQMSISEHLLMLLS